MLVQCKTTTTTTIVLNKILKGGNRRKKKNEKKEGNKNEKVETKSKNPIKLNLTKLDKKRGKITKNKIKMKAKPKIVRFLLAKTLNFCHLPGMRLCGCWWQYDMFLLSSSSGRPNQLGRCVD